MEQQEVSTPWSSVGYLTYKRTYSRPIDGTEDSLFEEWPNTVDRVITACDDQLQVGFTPEEKERLRSYMLMLKGTVAGRFLWQLGTNTVDKLGLASLQNCFSGDTEILTDKGSAPLRSLVDKDFSVLYKNVWCKATAKKFGIQQLNEVTFGMPTRSNYEAVVHVTPDHRWELADGSITKSLKVGDKVKRQYATHKWSEEGFRHGLVFGDGSINYRYTNGDYSFVLRLCGDKEDYKDLFAKYHYQPNCDGDPVAYHRSSTNFKELPTGQTKEYIASFIDGWLAADGTTTHSGTRVLCSQDDSAVQWLLKHAAYAGYIVTGVNQWDKDSNYGPRAAALQKVSMRLHDETQYMVVRSLVPLGEDEVYCAVVPNVERFTLSNGLLTCNCAFVVLDKPEAFTWAFDMLMLGSGVGYNIQREYVYKLPKVSDEFASPTRYDEASADFIVPDTREGWVKLLDYTLRSAFDIDTSKTRRTFSYSTQLIRGKGKPIKGFGGVASGPEDLVKGIDNISSILEDRRGKQLRPIDCLDIMNIIGQIVVSGNVRRSAQIAIGDPDDAQFLNAKRWDLGDIPSWRSNSNNSVVCNDIKRLPEAFWEGYRGNGEPYGLINLKLTQSCGRLGDIKYKDPNVRGFNPCAEQSLEDFETCCLAEIFLPNIGSYEELRDLTQLLYRVCKHSLRLPCHHPETQDVVHRNMRMGIGITGYLQATDEQRGWLKKNYNELRKYDSVYSSENGFPISIKLTTIKPSGTLSLLPGVTPGVHPAFSRYFIRRIRFSSDSHLVPIIRQHGYPVEYQQTSEGLDYNTVVAEFPMQVPAGTPVAEHVSALQQLEYVKQLQTDWSDNAVSCTIYYDPSELETIKAHLVSQYNRSYKSLSFLPRVDHGFPQPPLEQITEEEFTARVNSSKPITFVATNVNFEDNLECEAGVCPVK